jgi:hypothetical protein
MKENRDYYRMPHLDKIGAFVDEQDLGRATNAAVEYTSAIVQNRIANELHRLNEILLALGDVQFPGSKDWDAKAFDLRSPVREEHENDAS